MTSDSLNLPPSRSWRDIPQLVKPRAMSAGGRWRLAQAFARAGGAILLVGALSWGAWLVIGALRENPHAMPAATKAVPVKHAELKTTTGGVLDEAWLARTLALPTGISLMELDLDLLRVRLLADRQVLTASLTRNFPDRLGVQISERTPIARIRIATTGPDPVLLVARDGVVYAGTNYEPTMLATLPWLAGFALTPDGAGFRPIAGMAIVADLLASAQYEATHLYLDWQIVSLERLTLDRELEVTTKNGSKFVFTAGTDFFPQLAKLDHILSEIAKLANPAASRARIDLSLGREVPVMLEPLAASRAAAAGDGRPALAPGFNIFPSSPSKHPREH